MSDESLLKKMGRKWGKNGEKIGKKWEKNGEKMEKS